MTDKFDALLQLYWNALLAPTNVKQPYDLDFCKMSTAENLIKLYFIQKSHFE